MPVQLKDDVADKSKKPGVYVFVSERGTKGKGSKGLTIYGTSRDETLEAIKRWARAVGKGQKASA